MKLIRKRNKSIEDFLSFGPLEIDNLQSYFPTLRYIERVPYSKWNAISLEHLLIHVKDPISNRGTVTLSEGSEETKEVDFFIKCTPLFDTTQYMQGVYVTHKSSCWLPSKPNRHEETAMKIQNVRNTAYVDSLCSILLGKLKESGDCLHYGSVYGVYNGIYSGHTEDITEEYVEIKNKNWFKDSLESHIIRLVEKEEDRQEQILDFDEIDFNTIESDVVSIQCESDTLKQIVFDRLPVQVVIMEKFQMTFDDLLKQDWCKVIETSMFCKSPIKKYVLYIRKKICMNRLRSWVFQICAALAIGNSRLDLVHNDLHVQNIMVESTNTDFIYYSKESTIYKVPTNGYIIKIIDFGRATFKYDGHMFLGDVFEEDGEAGGQYHYYDSDSEEDSSDSEEDSSDSEEDSSSCVYSNVFDEYSDYDKNSGKKTYPKSSFDLCRFACSLLEDIHDVWGDISDYPIGNLLMSWVHDDNGRNILNIDGFNLYRHISRFVTHTIPILQFENDIMKEYAIDNIENIDKIYKII